MRIVTDGKLGKWLIKAATSAQDAVKLGIECGVRTIEGFKGVFRKYFGDEELPLAADLRLKDLVAAVKAELD